MSLSDTDKREICPVHGWVGRRAFQHDRHDLCAPAEVPVLDEDNNDTDDDTDDDTNDTDDDTDNTDDIIDGSFEDDEEIEDDTSSDESASAEEPSSRTARRCGIPPKKTIAVRRITRLELATGRAELKALGADAPYERPRIRGDCAKIPRPCLYVACKYSLYLDVSPTGSIVLNFPHLEPGEMPADRSCSLDLAEKGPMTLEYIAVVTNLTRERIRQVELRALNRKGRAAAEALGLGPEDSPPPEDSPALNRRSRPAQALERGPEDSPPGASQKPPGPKKSQ